MPIVIPREGPMPTVQSPLTQEQKDKLWEQIIMNWAEKHSEALKI